MANAEAAVLALLDVDEQMHLMLVEPADGLREIGAHAAVKQARKVLPAVDT